MQSRVQRAMFDLQDGIGSVFDYVRDGVAVGRAEHKGLQNLKVQGALEQVRL